MVASSIAFTWAATVTSPDSEIAWPPAPLIRATVSRGGLGLVVGHGDAGAFAGEGQRGLAADAVAAAGDQGDLAVEHACHVVSSLCCAGSITHRFLIINPRRGPHIRGMSAKAASRPTPWRTVADRLPQMRQEARWRLRPKAQGHRCGRAAGGAASGRAAARCADLRDVLPGDLPEGRGDGAERHPSRNDPCHSGRRRRRRGDADATWRRRRRRGSWRRRSRLTGGATAAHRRRRGAAVRRASRLRRCGPRPARSAGPSARWWTGGGRWR